MHCKKCNNQLPEGANPFCPFCGAPQTEDTQPPTPTEPSDNKAAEQDVAPASNATGAPPEAAPTTESAGGATPQLDDFGQPVLTDAQKEEIAASVADNKAGPTTQFPAQPQSEGFVPAGQVATPGMNPFEQDQTSPKKKMPTWGIVLIVLGILFGLILCCIIASAAMFTAMFDDTPVNGIQNEIIYEAQPDTGGTEVEEMPLYIDDSAEAEAADGSTALIQGYIDANRSDLDLIMQPILSIMGEGSSVDFQAADGEFIFALTYSDAFPSDGLIETLDAVLDASNVIYTELANQLSTDIEVSPLTVTVRYYQGGQVLTERSFTSTR